MGEAFWETATESEAEGLSQARGSVPPPLGSQSTRPTGLELNILHLACPG